MQMFRYGMVKEKAFHMDVLSVLTVLIFKLHLVLITLCWIDSIPQLIRKVWQTLTFLNYKNQRNKIMIHWFITTVIKNTSKYITNLVNIRIVKHRTARLYDFQPPPAKSCVFGLVRRTSRRQRDAYVTSVGLSIVTARTRPDPLANVYDEDG